MPAERSKHTRTVSISGRRIASGMYPALSPSNTGPSGTSRKPSTRLSSSAAMKRVASRKFSLASGTPKTALGSQTTRAAKSGTPPLIAAAIHSGILTPTWRNFLLTGPDVRYSDALEQRLSAVDRPYVSMWDGEDNWEDVDFVYEQEDQVDDLAALYRGFQVFEELGEVECVMGTI